MPGLENHFMRGGMAFLPDYRKSFLPRGRFGGTRARASQVRQEGQSPPVFQQRAEVECGADTALTIACVRENFAVEINDDGAPGIDVLRIAPDAVDTHNVGLVLDGARLQQAHPVMNSVHRPVGNDREQMGTAGRNK